MELEDRFLHPIINYPEVAILGIGRSEKKQVLLDGKFVTRTNVAFIIIL